MKMNKNSSIKPSRGLRRHGKRALLAVLIVLLIAGVYFLNALVYQAGQRTSLTADLTANAAYEIGRDTQSLLKSLDKDVDIYVMAKPNVFSVNSYFLQVQHIMEEYQKYSAHVKLSYVDYISDPTFAAKFPNLTIQEGDVLVVRGARVKQIRFNEMFNYSYNSNNDLVIVASRAEEALTSAFVNVITDKQLKAAVLTGNGVNEMTPFSDLLTSNNFTVSKVNIATDPLSSYDIALLSAPQVDLPEDVLKKLSDFLYNNGQYGKLLMYTADASRPAMPNVNTFLKEWGVSVDDGAVFETDTNRAYQNQPFYPVADYKETSYRDMLLDPSMPILMPVSHPIGQLYQNKDNYTSKVLLEFGATSGVRPSDAGSDFTSAQATKRGPMPAMILTTKNIYDSKGTLQAKSSVLVSSSNEMLNSFCIQNTSLADSQYLLNVFNAEFKQKPPASIEPKSLAGRNLTITSADANTIGILLFVILPLFILVSGIATWLVRRYK